MASTGERLARHTFIGVVVAVGLLGTFTGIGLYADGSAFALGIARGGHMSLGNVDREYVTWVTQAPLLVALSLPGDLPTPMVVWLHSFGLAGVTSLVWAWALWLHRASGRFWWFAAMWTVVYLPAGFFAIGEYNLTYALVGWSAAVLLLERRGPLLMAVLWAVAVVLLRSYESMVWLGVLLAVVAAVVAWRDRGWRRWATGGLAVCYLGSAVWAGVSVLVLSPEESERVGPATDVLGLAADPALLVAGVLVVGVLLAAWGRLPERLLVALVAVVAVYGATVPVLPAAAYEARVAVGGLLGVLVVAAWHRPRLSSPGVAVGVAVAAGVLVVGFVVNAVGFASWTGRFAETVRSTSGSVAVEDTDLESPYMWSWTNPGLSLLLQTGPGQGVVRNPTWYTGWAPDYGAAIRQPPA